MYVASNFKRKYDQDIKEDALVRMEASSIGHSIESPCFSK